MISNWSWKRRKTKTRLIKIHLVPEQKIRLTNPDDHMPAWLDSTGAPIPKADAFGLMGIINLTPDSFYAPSQCHAVDKAIRRAGELIRSGADVIDLGAESSRPGASPVTWQEECARLLPALQAIRKYYPKTVISVDTRNARTAEAALKIGATIINDISACSHDPELLAVLADYKPGYVLMHAKGIPRTMQVNPHYEDVMRDISHFFVKAIEKLTNAGLPIANIVIDPGFGFGKTISHNLEILHNLDQLASFGRPLLAGISMKSFLAHFHKVDSEKKRRQTGALLSAFLFARGCTWHRVHYVEEVKNILLLSKSINN